MGVGRALEAAAQGQATGSQRQQGDTAGLGHGGAGQGSVHVHHKAAGRGSRRSAKGEGRPEHSAAGIVVDAEGVERRARGGGVRDAPAVGCVCGVCAGELYTDPPTTEARAGDGFQVQGNTRYRASVH